jgi:hypoxanthine-DNA glycosylase
MLEKHAFGNFVPPGARYLILGSFTAKQAVRGSKAYKSFYDWFYSNGRNQFWPILEEVYGLKLEDKLSKQELFSRLGIAIADIILTCERKRDSNLDNNLINCVYNTEGIEDILDRNNIRKIFFTSRFVEQEFLRVLKEVVNNCPKTELITLPSPSPRFARMSKAEKITRYRELMPRKDLG